LVKRSIVSRLGGMGTKRGQQFGSVVVGVAIGVGLSGAGWRAIGPDHLVFAVVVQCAFLFMALLVGPALVDVRRSRYRVRAVEPRIYTLLGAEMVRRFLRGTEQSETAHLVGGAATVLLVITAVATSHPQGAVQILLVGVVLHGYPVLIQRIVRFRITNRRTSINRSAR
jgi:hypothetical protein